ncbi:hypothetical protein BSU04_39640 [Caballeronia sordidicola]|uniref:Uncharacterized protein n=1 Tax=Caballeronia sordidicola TaxID=196367 RepID=A0A226WNK7_CABSO|nr:hypothetical protein BSU04_39640 [Caballeronia sordidicola]
MQAGNAGSFHQKAAVTENDTATLDRRHCICIGETSGLISDVRTN